MSTDRELELIMRNPGQWSEFNALQNEFSSILSSQALELGKFTDDLSDVKTKLESNLLKTEELIDQATNQRKAIWTLNHELITCKFSDYLLDTNLFAKYKNITNEQTTCRNN